MKTVRVPFFISHQGCPHTCVFCDQRIISGSSGVLPTADEILEKIRLWQVTAVGRPLEVAFFGGSFTALSEELQTGLLEPLQPLLRSGEVAAVRISTRPDYVEGRLIDRLASHGVATVELGVQSLDDGVLAASGRGHSAAEAKAAIRCVRSRGVSVGAQLMPGLPGDTPAAALRSLEEAVAAGAEFLRLYPAVVLRGTELARRFESGDYIPLSPEYGERLCAMLLLRAMQLDVPVIRIGLQSDEGLNAGSVVAGCWHPSFGQLVRSRLYADLLHKVIVDDAAVTVYCNPSRVSDVAGHNRRNLIGFAGRGVQIRVSPEPLLAAGEIVVQSGADRAMYDILKDLNYSMYEV